MKEIDFNLPTPLVIGHSGGQTSAFQLKKFLDFHGGKLPDKVACIFMNTGDEDERALKFIERCSIEWDVPITWIEYRFTPFPDCLLNDSIFKEMRQRQFLNRKDKVLRNELAAMIESHGFPEQAESIASGRECLNGKNTYAIVNYATASRSKEPYDIMLKAREDYRRDVKQLKGVLPCPSQRLCTGELKVKTTARYVNDLWGMGKDEYYVALALRADERSGRAENALTADIEAGIPILPLYDAEITKKDIIEFWAEQPFHLEMEGWEGNCKNCFMKKRWAIERQLKRDPDSADWWIGWEDRTEDRFRRDRPSYRSLKWMAQHNRSLFDGIEEEEFGSAVTCEAGYCSD